MKTEWQGEGKIRLDRWLMRLYPEISRNYLQTLIQQGVMQINGRIVRKRSAMVSPGDQLLVTGFTRPEERRILPNSTLSVPILFQNQDYLIVDKPAGLPTHPNDYEDKDTLANLLLAKFPEIEEVGDERLRPGIVHRLDTDTSGLMVVARTQEAFAGFRGLFDQRKMRKTYLALVLGDVERDQEITLALAHHEKNPRKMVVVREGVRFRSRVREAKTMVRVLERLSTTTLIEARTLTGRMHQVRVHLSGIGHPLIGDKLYQSAGQRHLDRFGLKRHFLHASILEFTCPITGKEMRFESKLAPELEKALQTARSA